MYHYRKRREKILPKGLYDGATLYRALREILSAELCERPSAVRELSRDEIAALEHELVDRHNKK